MIVSDRQQPRGAERAGADCAPEAKTSDRGSFLGFVAHEMRNPLSTALWSAELLVRLAPEDRGGPRGEKLSNMCLRALQRLRFLVEDHFLAERVGVDGIPFKVDVVRLRDVLEHVAGKLGIEPNLTVDEALAVRADRGLLERVLDALLAVASQGKTPVQVQARTTGETTELLVSGAPPTEGALDAPHKGTPSDPTGRALALHMALKVVHALGGTLSASAEGYLLSLPPAVVAAPDPP